MTVRASVVWRRLDTAGHDAAILHSIDSGWRVAGTAVFVHAGEACCLHYAVDVDADWHTVSSRVCGWIGTRRIDVKTAADGDHRWSLDGKPVPAVAGCIDIDLAFTPATNILPVRRLAPAVGESRDIAAAWLTFPDFVLERLEQTYCRRGEFEYAYESFNGAFRADLRFLRSGFVKDYPGLWTAEVPRE